LNEQDEIDQTIARSKGVSTQMMTGQLFKMIKNPQRWGVFISQNE
jgi:hypothetical protein